MLFSGNAGWVKLAARNKRLRCVECGVGYRTARDMANHLELEAQRIVRLRTTQDARAMREWQEYTNYQRALSAERRNEDRALYLATSFDF